MLSVDLKDEPLDMVQPVCDLLRDHRRLNDVFVGSNSDQQVLESPEVPGRSHERNHRRRLRGSRRPARNDPNFVPAVTVDQPPFRSDGRQLVDAASLAWAHDHGIAILTWVVNDVDDMTLLVNLGVDGIYTSYPDRLLKLLGRCTAEC